MSTRVELEDIQTTKSENLLAVVLAIFLLIVGGREVVASCAECGSDRWVGVLHCGARGAT
jgi:hypothetical protein